MKRTLLTLWALAITLIAGAQCSASFTNTAAPVNNNLLRWYFASTSTYGTFTGNQIPLATIFYGDGASNIYFSGGYHTYASPGTYTVGLRIQKYDTGLHTVICTDSTTHVITVGYTPCGATISATAGSSSILQYTFTATNPAATAGMSYWWNFGDGTSGTGSPVTHTYPGAGTYTVTLTDSASGCTYTNVYTVVINGPSCSGNHAGFAQAVSGSSVTLNNNSITAPGFQLPTATWNYGDGTTGAGFPGTHTYAANGVYSVKLKVTWADSSNSIICKDSIMGSVTIMSYPMACSAYHASYTYAVSGYTVAFTNTSPTATPGYGHTQNWTFGDGYTSSAFSPSHTYTSAGAYPVKLITTYYDSTNPVFICRDSALHLVTVTAGPYNSISGTVWLDSTLLPANTVVRTYLIKYDSSTNMLSAVDSQSATAYGPVIYNFTGKPAGIYRTKAAIVNGPTSGYGYVPTYHDSSLYWSAASPIVHTGGTVYYQHIYMKRGALSSGPGFVGGNVSLGANKGASAGVPGISIYLLDNTGNLVASGTTDGNGDFSISNIPVGTYNVYPENMNYATTAYQHVVIGTTVSTYTNINFNQDNAKMSIKPRNTTGIAGAPDQAIITLYPNPAKGAVTLSWKGTDLTGAQVLITDLAGQIVYRNVLAGSSATSGILRISTLQSGMYFVRINNGAAETVQKLIIQ